MFNLKARERRNVCGIVGDLQKRRFGEFVERIKKGVEAVVEHFGEDEHFLANFLKKKKKC